MCNSFYRPGQSRHCIVGNTAILQNRHLNHSQIPPRLDSIYRMSTLCLATFIFSSISIFQPSSQPSGKFVFGVCLLLLNLCYDHISWCSYSYYLYSTLCPINSPTSTCSTCFQKDIRKSFHLFPQIHWLRIIIILGLFAASNQIRTINRRGLISCNFDLGPLQIHELQSIHRNSK